MTRSEDDGNGGETLDERGCDCGCVSAGWLHNFSSAGAAFTTPLAFEGGLDSVGEPVVVLSTFARTGCKTGFGDLAETKCLPPPGFEEKKEE